MSAFLEAALAYAAAGWKIFPIEPATKNPYRGTRGFRDATTDERQIRAWWEAEPTAWIAVALRMSGLVAVDVDPRNRGNATLPLLEQRFGALPRDIVQRSGSGGMHIIMADPSPGPDGWTRTAREGGSVRGKADPVGLGTGVDLKVNGYVLLEPSGKYRWEAMAEVAPPVPEAWAEGVFRKPFEPGVAPDAEGLEAWEHPSDAAPLPAGDRERLRAELRALGPRGSGSSTTFAAILRIFHDYGLSVDEGYGFLLEWNARCGMPRDEHDLHRQIRNIAESGRATGQRGNRRSDLTRIESIVRAAFDHRAVTLALPEPVAPAPVIATSESPTSPEAPAVAARPRLTLPPPCAPVSEDPPHPDPTFAAELERAAEHLLARLSLDTEQAARTYRRMFETAETLLARTFPPAPWLITSLLTQMGVHATSGEPKATKSWAATECAIALVTGTPAFGRFTVARVGRVAYFYAEDVGPSVQTRIRALTAGRANMAPGWTQRLLVQPRGHVIDLTRDHDLVELIANVRMHGDIDLLVLDPLRDIHSGEEDSADAMKPIMERMRALGDILGCAVMFVHHAAKASADNTKRRPGQRMRGSGAVHGAIDCGLHMWDLRGNEQTEFVTAVSSEIKAARSAGTFDLQLNITDGKHGTAEKAAWTILERARPAPKDGKPEVGLGDVLMTLFDHANAPMIDPVIAKRLKVQPSIVSAIVASAQREGFITRAMSGTTALGWTLTEKGMRTVQQGSSAMANAVAAPVAPHPATAAICNLPEEKT